MNYEKALDVLMKILEEKYNVKIIKEVRTNEN